MDEMIGYSVFVCFTLAAMACPILGISLARVTRENRDLRDRNVEQAMALSLTGTPTPLQEFANDMAFQMAIDRCRDYTRCVNPNIVIVDRQSLDIVLDRVQA